MFSSEFIKNTIANRKEDLTLEYKEYEHKLGFDIFDTVCSFSNRDGGLIIIGVNDKTREITGIKEEYIEQMQKEFTNTCSNLEVFDSKLSYELEDVVIGENHLLVVEIEPSPYVLRFKNRVYDRKGDADLDITNEKSLIQKIEIRKSNINSEDEIFPYCELSDLRQDLLDRARKYASSENRNHPWKNMDDEELLRSTGLLLKNMKTGISGITLAGILLFGKDEVINSVTNSNRTDCVKKVSNIDRYDDRDDIRTNLLDTYERMMSFVSKHLDDKFTLDEDSKRYSVRNALFREAVVNSIIHREYSGNNYARMTIFKDKVIFDNASISQAAGEVTLDNVIPKARNPHIAKIFNEMGLAEELGSGIINMYKYNMIYSGAYPKMIDGDEFVTTIPLLSSEENEIQNSEREKIILDFIESNGKMTMADCREILHLGKTQSTVTINSMLNKNKIYRHGNGRSTYYDKNRN